MKRDMDLIREILLAIENQHEYGPIFSLSIPDHSNIEVAYHCKILYEHGFIDSYSETPGDDELLDFTVGGLTWEGADYLEDVRDNTLWGKAKKAMKDKGIPLTIEFVKETINTMMTAAISSKMS